jgi:hypothetical protein
MGLALRAVITAVVLVLAGWLASCFAAAIVDPIAARQFDLLASGTGLSLSLFALYAIWHRSKADKIYGRPWQNMPPNEMHGPGFDKKPTKLTRQTDESENAICAINTQLDHRNPGHAPSVQQIPAGSSAAITAGIR